MTSNLQRVKEELAHYRPSRRCCKAAELSALLHTDGTFAIRGSSGHCLVTESSHANTARKIFTLIHDLFDISTTVVTVQRSSPRKQSVYGIEIPDQPGFQQVLHELGVLDASLALEPSIPSRLIRNNCCRAAAMRGAFLGGGYVSERFRPADMEITFSTEELASDFVDIFRSRGLDPGLRVRRGRHVLYLKSREDISSFLALTGAHGALLEWESQTIINSTKNRVNRLVNCDASNARRVSDASLRQREAIAFLRGRGVLDGLDENLLETARLRTDHPQASLAELGQLHSPPLSKSTVQKRMNRLERLAETEKVGG